MNTQRIAAAPETSEPRRPLHSNFTQQTLQQAVRAKQRASYKQQLLSLIKEKPSMKSFKYLGTIPGAIAAAAVIATGSVGVYALSNWFGGNVAVTQNTTSTFSVDLSSCKGNLPPGVEPTDDRSKVQFRIMGNPHISSQDLQQDLLGECEASAVTEFYAKQFPDAGFSDIGRASGTPADNIKYLLLTATVKGIDANETISLSSTGVKGSSFGSTDGQGRYTPVKSFTFTPDTTVYSEGQPAHLSDLRVGDNVTFVAYSASASTANGTMLEGTSILTNSDVRIISIFKTQYNDGEASFDYEGNNVLPLDEYNQLPNGQLYAK